MQGELALLRERTDRRDFAGAVNEPVFGRVGDRDDRRLDLMDVVPNSVADRANSLGRNLGALAFDVDELRASGEETGRAGLVDLNMSVLMAKDGAIGRAQG